MRPGHPVVTIALGALLVAGIALRVAVMMARGPAMLGPLDSGGYMDAARDGLFAPPSWPAGYPLLLLRVLHALDGTLSFAIFVQHALGVATALLLLSIVRRVAPPGWGLIPAGLVLLTGPQLLLEQTPLTEALFAFLVVVTCWCAVRTLTGGQLGWALAAGLAGVAAACVRPVGLALPIVAAAVVLGCGQGALRQRLRLSGAVCLGACLLLAPYVAVARSEGGYLGPGLARAGGWNLYVRVAPFADCRRFTPPPHARRLCERRPVARRPVSPYYLHAGSPGVSAFGSFFTTGPADDRALMAFGRAAVVHQPWDYLQAVGTDLEHFWSTADDDPNLAVDDYRDFAVFLAGRSPYSLGAARRWYSTAARLAPLGLPPLLSAWNRYTRLEGSPLVLLVLLALVGVALARGLRRAVALLLVGVSMAVLVGPVATLFFDPRYAVPGYGPLAAAGAIGAASLWERIALRARAASPSSLEDDHRALTSA